MITNKQRELMEDLKDIVKYENKCAIVNIADPKDGETGIVLVGEHAQILALICSEICEVAAAYDYGSPVELAKLLYKTMSKTKNKTALKKMAEEMKKAQEQ